MTEQEITALGPAFAACLRRFRDSFLQGRTAAHFGTYCRGLLSDLPRKSVEPIALAPGTAVRTHQDSPPPRRGPLVVATSPYAPAEQQHDAQKPGNWGHPPVVEHPRV